jgi:hypothetical protein
MDDLEFRDEVIGSLGRIEGQVDMLVDRVEDVEAIEPRVAVLEAKQRRMTAVFTVTFGAVGAFTGAVWRVFGS